MFGFYGSFSEGQIVEEKSIQSWLVVGGAVVKLVIGVLLLIIALTVAIPTDLFSSANWYDTLGIRLVFTESSRLFTYISQKLLPNQVSVEATGFAFMLFLFQISLQIKMAMLGGWKKNETPNQRVWLLVVLWRAAHGKIKPEDVNWQKVGY